MSDKEIQRLLSDPFLSTLTDENFNSTDFVSKMINGTELEKLVDTYFSYIEKGKQVDDVLTRFASENQEFLLTQFSIPKRYGVF